MGTSPVNPYESPRILTETRGAGVYFGTATRRLSIREYWWIAKSPIEFVLGVGFKILQINLPATFGIAHPRDLQVVAMEDLPAAARRRMAADSNQAVKLGFELSLCYAIPHIGPISGCAIAMRSNDGTVLAGIAYASSVVGTAVQEMSKFYFGSFLHDGRVVSTLGGKPDLESPAEVLRESYPTWPMDRVLHRHRERLRELSSPAIVVRDAVEVERLVRQREERTFEYQLERGVFVPLSEQEVQRITAAGANAAAPGAVTVSVNPGLSWAGTLSWLVMALGLYLFFRGPAANGAQWLFRVAVLALGIIGVILSSMIVRRVSTDDSRPG